MPLTLAGPGEEGIIAMISGSAPVRQHLIDLGFVEGGRVKVHSSHQGCLIVQVKEARIAMNRTLAEKIKINLIHGAGSSK